MLKRLIVAGAAWAACALLSGSTMLAQAGSRTGPPETTDKMNPFGDEKASPMAPAAATTEKLKPSDSAFLRKAAEGGVAEVELGILAKDKASDPDVKQFAQKMVEDHSKANRELKSLAMQKGVAVPSDPDSKTKKGLDRLAKLTGPDFDRAYMKLMVSDHEKDIAEFNKELQSASDPDLKDFVGKTLPTLQEHLKMAREDNTKVTGSKTS